MTDEYLILPDFDVMSDYSQQIKALTMPLKDLNITLFSHTQIFKDNSFIDISDRDDMLDYFYYQTDMHQYYIPDVDPWAFNNEFFLCSTLKDNLSITGLREELAIDNIIVLFDVYTDHCELWHFGTTPDNELMTNFYINNLHILKKFTYTFKNAASHIIEQAKKKRFKRYGKLNQCVELADVELNQKVKKLESSIAIDSLEFNHQRQTIKLRPREIEIIKWTLLGKTASEIAIILGISKRTVESHLANIKKRMSCYKVIDLVRVLEQNKLIDLILK